MTKEVVTLLLGGGLLVTNPAIAVANPLPPQLFSIAYRHLSPAPRLQVLQYRCLQGLPNLEFTPAPRGSSSDLRNASPGNMYEVDVYGDNPVLLGQVQRIVPDAFIRHREGIIQAGAFVEKSYAQERVQLLAAQGIRAQIKTVAARISDSPTLTNGSSLVTGYSPRASTISSGNTSSMGNLPTATENAPINSLPIVTGEPPRTSSAITSEPPTIAKSSDNPASFYFVVIPGGRESLDDMASRLVRLGISRENVREKQEPRGTHLAVGPFEERGLAERWSSYLRSAGMDARVYYGR